jgi:hypothetical protein
MAGAAACLVALGHLGYHLRKQVAVGAFRGRVAAASCVPGEVDALEALEKVFAKLRQILVREKPDVEYFSVDLRVASATPIPRP